MGAMYLMTSMPGAENSEHGTGGTDSAWKEPFSDSSNPWDNRRTKRSPRQPDFTYKVTEQFLWMDCHHNPSWIAEELIKRDFEAQHQRIESVADTLPPSLIWACCKTKDLSRGTRLHYELQKRGLMEKNYSDALVTMYAKCGDLQKAHALLDKHSSSNIIPWNALIASYARQGKGHKALDCFEQLQREVISPTAVTYTCILKACAAIGAIDKGKQIHEEILKQGLLEHDIVLSTALLDMYAKCGALSQAQSVLEKLTSRNVTSWNALIAGYAQKDQGQQALECFKQMQCEGIVPDAVTYACILKSCAGIGALEKGKKIHDEISKQGLLEHNIVLGTALVDMYAKCGALQQAQSVLEKLPSRNVVSWSALIAGYTQKGQGQQAMECFEWMQREGILPDSVTYKCILKACAVMGAIDTGKQIHDEILREGLLDHDITLGNALVDMYAKCGALPHAQSVLEKLPSCNVVSWNSLISGYAQNGQGQQALECFEQMQWMGIFPNGVTYVCVLKACASVGALDKGTQIYEEILRQGLLEHDIMLGNALVDMYAKCGALPQAQSVLEKLPSRNVVSWSALIAGYAQMRQGEQALECFERLQLEGLHPDSVTYVCVLNGCALIKALDKGKQIHDEILRQGLLEHDVILGNALVDMYAKCGAVHLAQSVLEKLRSRNVVSWNALIAGYAQKGQGQQALECFNRMQREGILPDSVTFLCLLNMCCHLGLVEKGQALFDSMEAGYGLKPDVECFARLVDLLGRAGHVLKAAEVVQGMPFSANSSIWHCLLGACQKWGDVNVGIWAFQQAVEVSKCDAVAHSMMANIYAAAGMQEKAKDIEAMRVKNKAWKLQKIQEGSFPSLSCLMLDMFDASNA